MRWIYYNTSDATEAAEHDHLVQKIDAWWAEFESTTGKLDALFRQAENWDLPGWMERRLQSIHPQLMWEFGPALNGKGHRLTITPEMHSELRPLAEAVVAAAPDISGWEFQTYRVPESVDVTLQTVQTRTDIELSDVTVAVSVGQDNRIDLVYRWNQLPGDDDHAFDAAFVATETLLGERALDRWVGTIQLVDETTPPERSQRFLPLDRLKPTFDALVNSTREQLPAEAWSVIADSEQWAVLKLEPQQADEYPERYDMLTCITCHPDLISATFSEAPFFSERFSRCDETFCYVKIDGADISEMKFHDREDLEEAVKNVLEADNLGALIGSGTGLRYSYLELSLTDVDRATAAIRSALQQGNVSHRSWILFHDAHLANEWIGIYDNSPAAPAAADAG